MLKMSMSLTITELQEEIETAYKDLRRAISIGEELLLTVIVDRSTLLAALDLRQLKETYKNRKTPERDYAGICIDRYS